MKQNIKTRPLTAAEFAPFGDVLDATGKPDTLINKGLCGRFHDRAKLDFGPDGRAGVSIFKSDCCSLTLKIGLVERHPNGSQTFIPMTQNPFLVVVAPDIGGIPGTPLAFLTSPGQGINLHRAIWHGVLSPLTDPGIFAVVDRISDTPNLEEHVYDTDFIVVP